MDFSCSIEVDAPAELVAQTWTNQSLQKNWQPDLLEIELLEGELATVGAKSQMKYRQGKNKSFILNEEIVMADLPNEIKGDYKTPGICANTMHTRFISQGSKTKIVTGVDYYLFEGFMIRMMAKLFPGMFRKQVEKFLERFKAFVETNRSTLESSQSSASD